MTAKKSYNRFFIIFQEEDKGYGMGPDRPPTGYAKVETRNDKSKVTVYVQNLKPFESGDFLYKCYLISHQDSKDYTAYLGMINIDDLGRGESSWETSADNAFDTKASIDKFNGAAIVVENESLTGIIAPLAGYMSKEKFDWRNKINIFRKANVTNGKETYHAGKDVKSDANIKNDVDIKSDVDIKTAGETVVTSKFEEYENSIVAAEKTELQSETIPEEKVDIEPCVMDNNITAEETNRLDDSLDVKAEETGGPADNLNIKAEEIEKPDGNLDEAVEKTDRTTENLDNTVKDTDKITESLDTVIGETDSITEGMPTAADETATITDNIDAIIKQEDTIVGDMDTMTENMDYVKEKMVTDIEDMLKIAAQEVDSMPVDDIRPANAPKDSYDNERSGHKEHKQEYTGCMGCSGYNYRHVIKKMLEDILADYEKMDKHKDLKECILWKVDMGRYMRDGYKMTMYPCYDLIFYPMMYNPYYNYIKHIRKHGHYIFGMKHDKSGKVTAIIYGIPGRREPCDQPMAGTTGFTKWIPFNAKHGYWIMMYDPMTGIIINMK